MWQDLQPYHQEVFKSLIIQVNFDDEKETICYYFHLIVLRFEARGVCENFKYIFDPFAIIFMDKLYKNLAYRKDFQVRQQKSSSCFFYFSCVNLVNKYKY